MSSLLNTAILTDATEKIKRANDITYVAIEGATGKNFITKHVHEIVELDKYLYKSESEFDKPLQSQNAGEIFNEPTNKLIEYYCDKRRYFVFAMDGDTVVGMLSSIPAKFKDTYMISEVVVAPEYRKRGIGSAMVQESRKIMKKSGKFKYAILNVNYKNANAFSVYKKLGFKVHSQLMLDEL